MILQYQLAYVKHTLAAAVQRKERLEELMSRKGAKKWDAAKKATMVRRLVAATQTVEQGVAAIDELTKKLEEVVARLNNMPQSVAAPFIREPATSEMPDQAVLQPVQTVPVVPEIESPFGA